MIIEAEQYILLTHAANPARDRNDVETFYWCQQGLFADQTEVVKWMMTTSANYTDFHIIKCKLPLVRTADEKKGTLDTHVVDAQPVELEDDCVEAPDE